MIFRKLFKIQILVWDSVPPTERNLIILTARLVTEELRTKSMDNPHFEAADTAFFASHPSRIQKREAVANAAHESRNDNQRNFSTIDNRSYYRNDYRGQPSSRDYQSDYRGRHRGNDRGSGWNRGRGRGSMPTTVVCSIKKLLIVTARNATTGEKLKATSLTSIAALNVTMTTAITLNHSQPYHLSVSLPGSPVPGSPTQERLTT